MKATQIHLALTITLMSLAFCGGYGYRAFQHRADVSPARYWQDMGEMAANYVIVKGQCAAARDTYVREREKMLQALQQDARRYGVLLKDSDYLKADLACGVK